MAQENLPNSPKKKKDKGPKKLKKIKKPKKKKLKALCEHFINDTCKFDKKCRCLHIDKETALNSPDYAKAYQRVLDSQIPADDKKPSCNS